MKKTYLVGNAHIDPVWLWQWQDGMAEVKATFRSALDRMKEWEDFTFTSACGSYYMWIEETDPAMFREIQERVKEGRWCLVGGWLLQPDCNIPQGESFARQALITQRYFLEKFGKMAETGYNVDSFGHNGNLPMILRQSRMKNYVFMRPGAHEKTLPQSLFLWESRDGSQVLAYRLPFRYCITDDFFSLFQETRDFPEECEGMAFYGVGNHGGGPTAALLARMHRELGPEFIYSTPDAYFQNQEPQGLPILKDDLQYHAKGCYSANARIKALNRQGEQALLRSERFSVLSAALAETAYPQDALQHAWQNLLYHQFHDILGGCSIRAAYEDADAFLGETLAIAARKENLALSRIAWQVDTLFGHASTGAISEEEAEKIGTPILVFNSHATETTGPMRIRCAYSPEELGSLTDEEGHPIPTQVIRDATTDPCRKYAMLFEATVPPLGYRVYRLHRAKAENTQSPLSVTEDTLENAYLRVSFTPLGEIRSLWDKVAERELLAEPSSLRFFDDEPYDTWAHDIETYDRETFFLVRAKAQILEAGPVRVTLRITQNFGHSVLVREYSLTPSAKSLSVLVKVDFRERFRIMKFTYPVAGADKALCQIPFGAIERPTDGSESVCGAWLASVGAEGGLGIATDSKHSFDAKDNLLSLTALRSAQFANHYGQRDEFCEWMEMGEHRFSYTLFPFRSEAAAEQEAETLGCPMVLLRDTFHQGPLPPKFSGLSVSEENITVSAVKLAEDGDGWILRCFETAGKETVASFRLLETEWQATLPPFGVATFRIRKSQVIETDFIE